ncbi:TPA: ATP-binding protein [Candidatus Poribacteria bacterium]|nr:ATP-binding protein [Candidatus Poribacteria bacterium]
MEEKMEKIQQVLFIRNPWWFEQKSDMDIPQTKRKLFFTLQENLQDERGLQIVGLRRTGKTTLLMQVINALLKDGVASRQILYLSADSVELRNVEHPIIACFQYFYEEIARQDEKIYLFIDEAHFSSTWAQEVKNLWDVFHPKIFVTGSSTLRLLRESRESLVGRMRSFYLGPLSLTEFSEMGGEPIEHNIPSLITTSGAFKPDDFKAMLLTLKNDPVQYEKLKRLTKPIFHQYLLRGGFPEGVFTENLNRYLLDIREDIIDRVLYKDIPELFGVRDRRVLYDLFVFTVYNSGNLFSFNSLAQTLGAKTDTISNYIQYLAASDVIAVLPKYARTVEGTLRTQKKVYVADVAIRNALLGQLDMADTERLSREAELLASTRLHFSTRPAGVELFYWRNRYEVDLVLRALGTYPIPLEVKYKSDISTADIKGLLNFMEREKVEMGYVLTRNEFRVETSEIGEVLLVPLWLFLLGL